MLFACSQRWISSRRAICQYKMIRFYSWILCYPHFFGQTCSIFQKRLGKILSLSSRRREVPYFHWKYRLGIEISWIHPCIFEGECSLKISATRMLLFANTLMVRRFSTFTKFRLTGFTVIRFTVFFSIYSICMTLCPVGLSPADFRYLRFWGWLFSRLCLAHVYLGPAVYNPMLSPATSRPFLIWSFFEPLQCEFFSMHFLSVSLWLQQRLTHIYIFQIFLKLHVRNLWSLLCICLII